MRLRGKSKRDANHGAIADALKRIGCTVVDTSSLGGGFPDMVVGRGNKTYLLEVKSKTGRPTEDQLDFIARWRGGLLVTVKTVEEALRAVGALPQQMVANAHQREALVDPGVRAKRRSMGYIASLALALGLWLVPAQQASALVLSVLAGNAADLRTQIGAAVAGDDVYVPRGDYTIVTPLAITAGITIRGDGVKTRIITATANVSTFNIDSTVSIDRLHIRDLALVGSGNGTTGGTVSLDGIHYGVSPNKHLTGCVIERVTISGFRNGIFMSGNDIATGSINHLTISDCEITTNDGRGVWLQNVSMGRIERCEINGSGFAGIYTVTCPNVVIYSVACEGNNTRNSAVVEEGAQITLKLSHRFIVSGLDVESLPTAAGAVKVGLCVFNTVGGLVQGYGISMGTLYADSYAIQLSTGSRAIGVASMNYQLIQFPITADGTSQYPQTTPRTIVKF